MKRHHLHASLYKSRPLAIHAAVELHESVPDISDVLLVIALPRYRYPFHIDLPAKFHADLSGEEHFFSRKAYAAHFRHSLALQFLTDTVELLGVGRHLNESRSI